MSEKLSNKTCGNCKHFDPVGQCKEVYEYNYIHPGDAACEHFKARVITNGDKLRQKTNEQFAIDYANYSKTHNLYVARLCPLSKQLWTTMEEAIQANLDFLNAPAESEENNE
jgi:hypothetical protein